MEESNRNEITRRQLFGAMAAMGVVTVGAGLLGGCSSSRAGRSSQSASAASQSASASAAGSSSAQASASSASSASASAATNSLAASSSASAQSSGGVLVAVFSWSGNTLTVANRIVEDLNAMLFRIEPATPYTTNYDEMLQIAQNERSANTLPALAGSVSGWDGYSTVYLGFPTWWGHLPQIVKSFLAEYDCTGKTVYPFNTHGGSGFASCLSDLSEACPKADVRDGLSLVGDSVSSNLSQVDAWVSKNA